jgi:type II secretory pathway pseudopilin PulG
MGGQVSLTCNRRARGVTVSELLFVIAIIVVLAAIVLTVSRSSVRRANTTVCASNLRQYFLALQLYRDEWGDYPGRPFETMSTFAKPLASLRCTETKSQTYWLHWPVSWDMSAKGKAVWKCGEIRGGEMPLVSDVAHVKGTLGDRGVTGQKVLMVREHGNISLVEASLIRGGRGPCDTTIIDEAWINF